MPWAFKLPAHFNKCAQLGVLLGLREGEVGREVKNEIWHSQELENMAFP